MPVRIASELGRKEFVLVALVAGEEGPVAFPTAKGSGSVTSFSQAARESASRIKCATLAWNTLLEALDHPSPV